MNNKGFTLIELLGVIVILIVIFLVIYPATRVLIERSEKTVYQTQINKILKASYDYSLNNLSVLPTKNEKSYITLAELIYNGYVDPLKNPNTDDYFPDDGIISIENVGNKYRNREKDAIRYGDYLFKVEFDDINTDEYVQNKPKIVIQDIEKTSKGYTTILNQGDVFVETTPIVYDSNDVDITNSVRIITNIFFDDEIVTSVDTSKIGIYTIRFVAIYTDTNKKVYSSSEVWNVVIADIEPPEIVIPGNETLSITDTTFDIMNGVSCVDNGGDCTVTYDGILNFGIQGTYTIEYKATDKSGNVATATRVITIQ